MVIFFLTYGLYTYCLIVYEYPRAISCIGTFANYDLLRKPDLKISAISDLKMSNQFQALFIFFLVFDVF